MLAALHGLLRRKGIAPSQERGALTPRAGTEMVPKAVLGVGRAGHEGVSRLVERTAPGQGIRARLGVSVPVYKTAHKQVLEGRMQDIKGRCMTRRDIGHGLSAVSEQPGPYTTEGL